MTNFTRVCDHYPPIDDPGGGRSYAEKRGNGADRVVVYHVTAGPAAMARIDAQHAVSRFPNEWAATPWPAERAP